MNHPAAYRIKIAPMDHTDWSGDTRDRINRGAVEEVGPGILDDEMEHERWSRALRAGNTVYYQNGIKIHESIFIEPADIISYDEESFDADSQN